MKSWKIRALKHYFAAESLKRASFRGELETLLHTLVVDDVKESGTASGAIHRTWADVKAKLGGGDHTLLETAEAGEDAAKKAYKEALENDLPLPVKQRLDTQYAHIQTSHDDVKHWHGTAANSGSGLITARPELALGPFVCHLYSSWTCSLTGSHVDAKLEPARRSQRRIILEVLARSIVRRPTEEIRC